MLREVELPMGLLSLKRIQEGHKCSVNHMGSLEKASHIKSNAKFLHPCAQNKERTKPNLNVLNAHSVTIHGNSGKVLWIDIHAIVKSAVAHATPNLAGKSP